jgi:hypothetical protein
MAGQWKPLRQEWEQVHPAWSTDEFVQGQTSEVDGKTIDGQFMIQARRKSDGKRVAGSGDTPESALQALTTVVIREG